MQDEAAHVMSPSNVTQPFNVASVCVEANKTFIAYVDAINTERTASVKALSSVWPSLWPRVDLLIARWEVCFKQKHMSGGTVNTDFWTFLSHAVRKGGVQRIRHDPVTEPHLLAPAKRILPRGGFLHPVASLFSIFTSLTLASLQSITTNKITDRHIYIYSIYVCTYFLKWLTFLFNKARNLPNLKVLVGCDSSLLCASKVDYCCHPATTSMIITH